MVETTTTAAVQAADFVRLEAAGHVDCATLLPVEVTSLPRGLHPRCVAFHPIKPLLAVGVQTCVGGYDLVTGVRLGRVDLRTPAVALMFSRDGSLLVVATQEWHIIGINTSTWRSRVLAPMTEPRSGPLDSIMMAITGGSRPVIFFTRYGKNSIRMAVNSSTGPASAKAKAAEKKLKWGVKLRLDVNKPVVGLAAHPTASQLLVLFDDGSLRGYALTPNGLQMIWPAAFMLPGDAAALGRLSLTQSPCQTLPHPFIEGGCLLAISSGSGSLLLLELVGRAEPRVVMKAVTPDNAPVIGVGLQQEERVLFAFTGSSAGQLEVLGWQLLDLPVPKGASQTSGLALEPITVNTDDLDSSQTAAAAAHGSSSKAPQLVGAAAGSSSSSSAVGGFDWQSLWGCDSSSDAALEAPSTGSFLLDKLLAPVVQSAVLHPTLGCVAVQRAPPLALRQAANIMQQRLGQISAPEAAISRRTASVPLLRLLHSARPEAGWPGGRVAALHTGLNFWQTAAGMGPAKLQFPCHLYYLSPGKLSKYALASKKSGCFVDLPPADTAGRAHVAKHLVHSSKQHAWLVFFESTGSSSGSSSSSSRVKGGSSSSSSDGGWHFTLVQDAAAAGQASWFLPGRTGVFLGPQDLFFAVQSANSSTLSVYRTPGFKGKGLPLYVINLSKPSTLGAGLFAGPPALAAPYVGAEAAAKAAKEAGEAAEKAAKEAAEAAGSGETAAAGAAAGAAPDAGAAAAAVAAAVKVQAPAAVSSITGRRIRKPGETWRPSEDDGESSAGDMMVPVVGIGSAYQHAGMGSSARRFGAAAHPHHHHDEAAEESGQLHSGGGVVMWHQAGGKLVMGALPAPGLQYAAGEDSDDPDAAESAATAAAPDMGQVAGEHSLQLQPNERVVSVAWQELAQGPPLEPYHCAAAILTTQRLLLVSGDLTLLAAVDASCGSVGLSSAITSFLWVGPALLYMTAGGQVMQLTWTGQVQHMASVASSPPPLLAAALTDSLLLLRQNPITGEHEVASRAVGVLQPLVLGWTSLASCGLLPKGLNTARAALQALLEAFDATHVTSGMLWALIQGWCGDVAAALASHAADVEPSVQLAANAAAGRWPAVVSSLRGEHQRSVWYPRPAPQGSQLHHKLLAAAAGAIMHGQFSCSQECLEAAGEWETAMALAVCAGDFAALRSMAAGVQSSIAMAAGGEREAQDIARLARGLVAAYERSGRAFSLAGSAAAGGAARDWRLRAVMADDSFFSNASDWSFGGPGKMPYMETSSFNAPAAFIQDGEVGPLPRADAATLGAYLGNSDLALLEEPGAAAAGMVNVRRASSDHDFLANLDQLVALSSQRPASATSDGKGGLARTSIGASSVSSGDGGPAAAAAAAGTTSGAGGQARDSLFDFSDDEDETSFGWAQRTKFKIHIKSKEEAEGANPAAAGSTGASTPELRSAVQKLKLGPPGTPGGSTFKEAFAKGGSSSKAAESARSSDESGAATSSIDALYDLSFLANPSQSPGSSAAAAAGSSSSSSGLPPKGPSAAGGSSGSLNSLSALAGLSSSGTPGLGGPAMRPKPPAPLPPPVISDDDFFAALAPVIPEASKGKLLSPPPPPIAAAAPATTTPSPAKGGSSSSTAAAGAAAGAAARPAALAPPPGQPAAAAAAAGVAAAGATGSSDATAMYLKGVSEMESANWDAAINSFGQTLAALQAEPPSSSQQQRQAFAAQYLAAVMLLKAAGAGASAKEAKLYRYACGLKLDDKHSMALVKEAVLRNKHVGNYRYAADQLTWMVTRSLGSAPMEVMARLQEDIDECDRKGGRNASIPADEKVEEWGSIVASCCSRQEVEEVVMPLLADS